MFKFLRSKARVFYWVIAGFFVVGLGFGLTVGAGIGSNRSRSHREEGIIGSVNGLPLTAFEFDNRIQGELARLRQQNQDATVTANQRAGAAKRAWDTMVRSRIEEDEIQRLNLTATDQEILDIMKNNPPQELLAQFRDKDGNPDMSAYFAALSDPERDWSGVERWLRDELPRRKLQQIITAGAVVTDEELQEAYWRQFGRAVAEYMGMPFDKVTLESSPSEEDLRTYYEAHQGKYLRPRRASVKVVAWPLQPSEQDRQDVRQEALEIKQEIESGEKTFADAAALYSDDSTTAKNGGDLGTFDRERMVKPFSDVAFSLPVGQISDPVETQFGYHLIEVLDRTMQGDKVVQVHARHILLKIEPGQGTLSELYADADDFRQQAAAVGFLAAAASDSLDVKSPEPFQEGREIPGVRDSLEGSYYALGAKAGAISPVMTGGDSYYVLWVESLLPEGPAPLDEVRPQVESEWQTEQKRSLVAQKLATAVAAVQGGEAMATAAEPLGLVHAVTDTITTTANIPDVGYGTAFNYVALNVPEGTLVPDVETTRGLFALRTLWKEPFDQEKFDQEKENLRNTLLYRKQRELVEQWYQKKIAAAKVIDDRYMGTSGGA